MLTYRQPWFKMEDEMALISNHVRLKLLFKRRRRNLHRNIYMRFDLPHHFISSAVYNAVRQINAEVQIWKQSRKLLMQQLLGMYDGGLKCWNVVIHEWQYQKELLVHCFLARFSGTSNMANGSGERCFRFEDILFKLCARFSILKLLTSSCIWCCDPAA